MPFRSVHPPVGARLRNGGAATRNPKPKQPKTAFTQNTCGRRAPTRIEANSRCRRHASWPAPRDLPPPPLEAGGRGPTVEARLRCLSQPGLLAVTAWSVPTINLFSLSYRHAGELMSERRKRRSPRWIAPERRPASLRSDSGILALISFASFALRSLAGAGGACQRESPAFAQAASGFAELGRKAESAESPPVVPAAKAQLKPPLRKAGQGTADRSRPWGEPSASAARGAPRSRRESLRLEAPQIDVLGRPREAELEDLHPPMTTYPAPSSLRRRQSSIRSSSVGGRDSRAAPSSSATIPGPLRSS